MEGCAGVYVLMKACNRFFSRIDPNSAHILIEVSPVTHIACLLVFAVFNIVTERSFKLMKLSD